MLETIMEIINNKVRVVRFPTFKKSRDSGLFRFSRLVARSAEIPHMVVVMGGSPMSLILSRNGDIKNGRPQLIFNLIRFNWWK